MTVEIGVFRVSLWFKRLFADPRLFEKNANLARQYLESAGLSEPKSRYIIQPKPTAITDEKSEPSKITGVAKYIFQEKKTRSEYMENTNLVIDYLDVGADLSPDQHHQYWAKQKLWTMPFVLKNFNHQLVKLNIPAVEELYSMVKERAQPTTIASVELNDVPHDQFDLAMAYLETHLARIAEKDSVTLEVYASRDLELSEREALDKRLTRESTASTVYLILGAA
ncbi:hypothetical protein E6H16_03815 [Candidatus Bathyarchaeota archaeon]|nr:MAG: hypothetical protein E6H16_03815 [Candidatus Bathyarchaeota archaeon]